jgi:hypothetical protein
MFCGSLGKALTNKKSQIFVVMSFFEFESAACSKKRHAKTEHHNKHLALLILSQL